MNKKLDTLNIYFIFEKNEIITLPLNDPFQKEDFLNDFLFLFFREEKNLCQLTAHPISRELSCEVNKLIEKYSFLQNSSFQKIKKKIETSENKYFLCTLIDIRNDMYLINEMLNSIIYADGNMEVAKDICEERINKMKEEVYSKYGDIIKDYNIDAIYCNGKCNIGEKVKDKRVCRFCQKSMKEGVFFKKIAHAIPEAIGNKNIILNEECDTCNEFFGNNIEPDFINSLGPIRTIYKMNNKKGNIPKLKSNLSEVSYCSNENKINIKTKIYDQSEQENTSALPNTSIQSPEDIIPINIYKALVKMTLSVISKEELIFCEDAISWVRQNDEKKPTPLPKIAKRIHPEYFQPVPKIIVFKRKNSDETLPYIFSELTFACMTYIYILPFCCNDKKDFSGEQEMEEFIKKYKLYNKKSWVFDVYERNSPVRLVYKINFQQSSSVEKINSLSQHTTKPLPNRTG